MIDRPHPLDRPVWNTLTTRQADFAIGDAAALRFRPEINLFGAAADRTPDCLAALVALLPPGGTLGLVEADATEWPPGVTMRSRAILNQMVLTRLSGPAALIDFVPLTDDDAPAMLALATLTVPGPFFSHTHTLGDFVGVKRDGLLLAMAGERMKPPGFTEVSAVCTHPDHRGQGHARALMQLVIGRILARGEAAFLHVYPDNAGAIGMYEAMGFRFRQAMTYTVLERGVD